MVDTDAYVDYSAYGNTPGHLTPAYLSANRGRYDIAAVFIRAIARHVSGTKQVSKPAEAQHRKLVMGTYNAAIKTSSVVPHELQLKTLYIPSVASGAAPVKFILLG